MREDGSLELASGLAEQPLVVRLGEWREEFPRPFFRFPGQCIAACLQDKPVAALPALPGRAVDFLQ